MHASPLLSTLDGGERDLMIRYLPEADQRLNCTRLARLEVIAACSPAPLFDAKLIFSGWAFGGLRYVAYLRSV